MFKAECESGEWEILDDEFEFKKEVIMENYIRDKPVGWYVGKECYLDKDS